MKKVKFLLVSLISIFAFNINVFAASGSLGVSSSSVYVGDSFTITANVSSAAAWNIHVSASGPVSGCSINQADATADAMDTNKTFSATCTATGTGTITIRLSGDVTSASNGNAVNVSGSRSVSVSNRPTKPTPNNNNNNTNNNNNINNKKSNNNAIKEIKIEGYDLVKLDNNNYTLSVPNDVTSINVVASAQDAKAKVTGAGNHDIQIGDNTIEIIVTAENGAQNKITIKVTRKDSYYLEDLDAALKNDKSDGINIKIKADDKITAADLEKIKNSKKTVKLNYYNEYNNLIYTWIIDGSKIGSVDDLETAIVFDSKYKKEMLKASNYADSLMFSTKQSGKIMAGTKIRLFVGNKYENNDLVNVYAYIKNNDKLEIVATKLKVVDGYVEFDAVDATDYLVTMSTIPDLDIIAAPKGKSGLPIIPIVLGVIGIVLAGLIVFVIKKKNNKTEKVADTPAKDFVNRVESNSVETEMLDLDSIPTFEDNNIDKN